MAMSALPQAALSHILQFVPQEQRLRDCALVSTSWAEAAAAATRSIDRHISNIKQYSILTHWVGSRAQHVSTLELYSYSLSDSAAVEFPALWPALRQLHVRDLILQLSGTSLCSPHGPPSAGTTTQGVGLTQLHLTRCRMPEGLQALTALAALSSLEDLAVNIYIPPMQQSTRPRPEWAVPCSTWTALTALRRLDLSGQHNVNDQVLQVLTCLTRLQELRLRAAQLSAQALHVLQDLPHLSALQLSLAPQLAFSCSSTPWLTAMPCLQHLQLFCFRELQPSLLASLSGRLQSLDLEAFRRYMTPLEATECLCALSQLTGLTRLRCSHVLKQQEDPYGLQSLAGSSTTQAAAVAVPPEAGAALTASSRLHSLILEKASLPSSTWQYIFSAQRQLLMLRELAIVDMTPALSDESFEQLASCCTALTGLTLLRSLQPWVVLSPLQRLTNLQTLQLKHVHGDSAAGVLAQLTRLRFLDNDDAHLTRAGLLQLTALRQLTRVYLHCSLKPYGMPQPVALMNKASDCSAPDVWRQLQELCG